MNDLRKRLQGLLVNENQQEEVDEDAKSSDLIKNLGVFMAASRFIGKLHTEPMPERIEYKFSDESSNRESQISDISDYEEANLADAEALDELEAEDGGQEENELVKKRYELRDFFIRAYELQRHKDEVETRLGELEHDGVELEEEEGEEDNSLQALTGADKLKRLIEMARLRNILNRVANKLAEE